MTPNEPMKLQDIKPYPKNAKKHPEEQVQKIANSIREFGFNQPIVVDRNNEIIVGHGRFLAAQKLGLTEVLTIKLENLSEEQVKAYRLADNKLNESNWEMEKVIEDLRALDEASFDIDLTGFSRDLILEPKDDDFDAQTEYDSIQTATISKGDIYKLGNHRLMCGDATLAEDVDRLMAGAKSQMVFTDPPYNVGYEGGGSYAFREDKPREAILNDKMSRDDFYKFLKGGLVNMMRYCDGVFYICMGSSEIDNLRKAFEEAGGHWQAFIIWVKNTFTLSRADWQSQYEPILYGWNGNNKDHYFAGFRNEGNVWENLEVLKPRFEDGKTFLKIGDFHVELEGEVRGKICRKKDCTDIWREKKPSKSKEHPTMKPIPLVVKALRASSKVGDNIMDLFGGSGTTLIAAEQIKRNCYMMELDPKYSQVIVKRWEKLTGQKAEKVV